MEFLRRNTDADGQDHAAGPVHHEPAGEGRVLQGRRSVGDGLSPPPSTRRCAIWCAPAPTSSSSTSRGCATIPRRHARYGVEGHQPRARGVEGADGGAPVLRLRRGGARRDQAAPATAFLAELAGTIASTDLDRERAAEASTSACSRIWRRRTSCSACSIWPTRRSRRRRSSPRASAAASKHVPAERLIPAPDCGMKYLPREVAFGKLKAMVAGAAIVRNELS